VLTMPVTPRSALAMNKAALRAAVWDIWDMSGGTNRTFGTFRTSGTIAQSVGQTSRALVFETGRPRG
jgi:hypothetical protein